MRRLMRQKILKLVLGIAVISYICFKIYFWIKLFQIIVDKENITGIRQSDNVYIQRRETLLQACTGHTTRYRGHYNEQMFQNHIYLNPQYHVLYCGIEKVGLTFWRRMFRALNSSILKSPYEIEAFMAYQGESFAHVMTLDETHNSEIIKSSFKFLFVRNPYERLYSAYIDKLFFPNVMYWKSVGRLALYQIRKNASFFEILCGHSVSFPEFVKYFIEHQNSEVRDNHFIPLYEHCRPCEMQYDFIGKIETFHRDMTNVLRAIGAKKLADNLKKPSSEIDDTINRYLDLMFFYRHNGTECDTYYSRCQRLWKTFQVVGRINKSKEFPLSEQDSQTCAKDCLFQILKQNIGVTNHQQRQDYLTAAYSSISNGDMSRLRRILEPDCRLFGYEC